MTWAVAMGVTLIAAGTASAQPGRFGGPGLVANAGVQEELKLNNEQKQKAADFAEKLNEKMMSVFQDAGGDFTKMQAEGIKLNAAGMKDVAGFLNPDQLKRLKQISWQLGGLNALATDEEVQKELKLTNEEKDKLTKMANEQREKTVAMFQEGFGPEMLQKMQAMRKEYGDKAVAALTADHQKAYKDLLGKPFEVKFDGPG
jgi:hypothetical protein